MKSFVLNVSFFFFIFLYMKSYGAGEDIAFSLGPGYNSIKIAGNFK